MLEHPNDHYWWDGFRLPGAGGYPGGHISDAAVYKNELYVVGAFTWIGETAASCIARWDGERWHPLGSGLFWDEWGSPKGYSLAVYDGLLIAGGQFVSVDGVWTESIAAWDGESWSALDDGLHSGYGYQYPAVVYDLVSHDGSLYAAGWFIEASGQTARSVARWDGSEWHPLGVGIGGTCFSICGHGAEIIVGGAFEEMGDDTVAGRIAAWNGSTWSTMNGGMDDRVYDLTVYGSDIVAAGSFRLAGGVIASRLAAWDGSQWREFAGGADDAVVALDTGETELFAGGSFSTIGGIDAGGMALWNGSMWESLAEERFYSLREIVITGEGLVAVGSFTRVDDLYAAQIARHDGTEWSVIGGEGHGFDPEIYNFWVDAVGIYEGRPVVGGDFNQASGLDMHGLAQWNGEEFEELGGSITDGGHAKAFCEYRGDLVVSGGFGEVGGVQVDGIATWNGTSWHDMAGGIDSRIDALTVFDDKLIAGGWSGNAGGIPFTHVVAWDGESWSALGNNLPNVVYALIEYQGQLIAGGNFDYAAKWDGQTWINLGSLSNGMSSALTEHQGELILGGQFPEVDGIDASCVAAWNGGTWRALGAGLYGRVLALASDGEHLVAGGVFTESGSGEPMAYIAYWDGLTWHPLGSGMNGNVLDLQFIDGLLYAVGSFELAGGKSSTFIARWDGFDPTAIDDPDQPAQGEWRVVNVPNPFNPTTEIRCDLPAAGPVTLRIYDTNGRLVRTLLNGDHHALGELRINWNGRGDAGEPLASGVYFYEVEVGEHRTTRKMTLLK
ncbi:MAG: T9SS type A sorting domain-containing protein [bacterium]|nr:T9SS type A sorting domain-containing protein [bacterium]